MDQHFYPAGDQLRCHRPLQFYCSQFKSRSISINLWDFEKMFTKELSAHNILGFHQRRAVFPRQLETVQAYVRWVNDYTIIISAIPHLSSIMCAYATICLQGKQSLQLLLALNEPESPSQNIPSSPKKGKLLQTPMLAMIKHRKTN